jgi:ribonuclease HII
MINRNIRSILNFSIYSHSVKLRVERRERSSLTMLNFRHTKDTASEVGIDEAGRGCFWGPLFAAAVIWIDEEGMSEEQQKLSAMIRDSKKISEKRRMAIAEGIKKHAKAWGIGSVSSAELQELGVTKANQLAFARALVDMECMPERIIIDGCLSIYEHPWAMIPQVVEPEADSKYIAVAAASILAKTGRDAYVLAACKETPSLDEQYGLASNKGYGTLRHRNGILEHGTVSEHRPQFLRKLLSQGPMF